MNSFISFVRKEFFHILRDPRTMLILIGMPIAQIILFGFAISVEIRGISIAVISPENSNLVEQIANDIDANEYFTVEGVFATPQQAMADMKNGKLDMILNFPYDFERKLNRGERDIQMIVDASNPNNAASMQNYLTATVGSYFAERNQGIAPKTAISTDTHLLYNPGMESSYNFVPGIMGLILLIICAMMTSVSIVREKEVGTMEVLLVSPVRPIVIILAKMIPYFVVSCLNLTIILLLSKYVLGTPLAGSLFWISFTSLIYILLSLGLGLFISTIAKTQMVALLVSVMLLLLPVLMLSGMIFPIESAPKILQYISNIVPAKWYIMAMRKLMIEGLPMRYVITEFAILSSMMIVLVAASLKKFKNRLS